MAFLAPWGFIALLALPIIVALHLVRLQRRRVRLPTLELWQRVAPQPMQRTHRLPWTPLLLLHLLAAACLALALTQPLLRNLLSDAPTHTIVLLDTTTSMGAVDSTLSRFERAQRELKRTIADLGAQDTLVLISLNQQPQILASGSGADSRELDQALTALRPAGTGSDLARGLTLANASLAAEQTNQIVIYSDLTFSPTLPLTAAAALEWKLIGGPIGNQAVTAFAARQLPDDTTALYARILNTSDQPVNRSARLLVDGVQLDQVALGLPANGSVEHTWRIPVGANRAELILTGGDALAADDRAVTALGNNRRQRVRLISAAPTALERVLAALPGLDVSVAERFSTQSEAVGVTVLNGVLPPTLPSGALLLVNPPLDDSRLKVEHSSSRVRASSATVDNDFALVDLSSVQWGERRAFPAISQANPKPAIPVSLRPIINDVNDIPLVLGGTLDERAVIVWMFDVDASNLPAKVAFPLLMAATLERLTTGGLPATMAPGSPAPATPLQAPNGEPTGLLLDQPGWYALADNDQAGLAVNFGAPEEADLAPQAQPAIAVVPIADTIQSGPIEQTRGLWPWLAALGLLVIAAEWWYVNGRPAPATLWERLRNLQLRP